MGMEEDLKNMLQKCLQKNSPEEAWMELIKEKVFRQASFEDQRICYQTLYEKEKVNKPVWVPNQQQVAKTHVYRWMQKLKCESLKSFHQWTCANRSQYWQMVIDDLKIPFRKTPSSILDHEDAKEKPNWLPGAKLNISESCFQAKPEKVAIFEGGENRKDRSLTYKELDAQSSRLASALLESDLKPGDRVAIVMSMNIQAVVTYLAIIKAGCVVVSIADSFSSDEIKVRLKISGAKRVFTQAFQNRGGKHLAMYEKVVQANGPAATVYSDQKSSLSLREGDQWGNEFQKRGHEGFIPIEVRPEDHCNILFSSGTTGEPKAIPWNHTTPLKCAADAMLHHDIHEEDRLAWPTNLGWMMGPWMIYASFINQASMAIYDGSPSTNAFGEFISRARVTMLGVIPSLVKAWRESRCMETCDWSAIERFSSTGECSNSEDMHYLMHLADYKPVVEYCGGTEIGGGYITGTLAEPCTPATFSSPAFGLNVHLYDEKGEKSQRGEVYLEGPSIGLSTELLNKDHHEVYFNGSPRDEEGHLLRRHGDELECLSARLYRAHGRVDDTMNIGGIKTSAAEIESVVMQATGVQECAAITRPQAGGGPEELIIFAVVNGEERDLKKQMQLLIREKLNPLFKIKKLHLLDQLPRTASGKVMRRVLRSTLPSEV